MHGQQLLKRSQWTDRASRQELASISNGSAMPGLMASNGGTEDRSASPAKRASTSAFPNRSRAFTAHGNGVGDTVPFGSRVGFGSGSGLNIWAVQRALLSVLSLDWALYFGSFFEFILMYIYF